MDQRHGSSNDGHDGCYDDDDDDADDGGGDDDDGDTGDGNEDDADDDRHHEQHHLHHKLRPGHKRHPSHHQHDQQSPDHGVGHAVEALARGGILPSPAGESVKRPYTSGYLSVGVFARNGRLGLVKCFMMPKPYKVRNLLFPKLFFAQGRLQAPVPLAQ